MKRLTQFVVPVYLIISGLVMISQLNTIQQQESEINSLHKDRKTNNEMMIEWKTVCDSSRKVGAEFGYEAALAGWSRERLLHYLDELHARAQVTVIQSNYFESTE